MDYAFALAELGVRFEGRELAHGATVTALDSIEMGDSWGARLLVDAVLGDTTLAALREVGRQDPVRLLRDPAAGALGWARIALRRERLHAALLTDDDQRALDEVRTRLVELEGALAGLPARGRVYAAATDFVPEGSFTPSGGSRPVHLLERGEVSMPREILAPAPVPVPGMPEVFELEADAPEGSRRLALANCSALRDSVLASVKVRLRMPISSRTRALAPTTASQHRRTVPGFGLSACATIARARSSVARRDAVCRRASCSGSARIVSRRYSLVILSASSARSSAADRSPLLSRTSARR